MHHPTLLIVTIATAASFTAAATTPPAPPPQITSPPSNDQLKQRENLLALAARRVVAGGRAFQVNNPRKGASVPVPVPANEYSDLPQNFWSNSIERDCMLTTYPSIIDSDIPPVTDPQLSSWVSYSPHPERSIVRTISDISQLGDDLCVTTDDTNMVPSSLTSAFLAWAEELQTWKKGFHDEAYSIADECGTRFGPIFSALVATDLAECRAAASALFGYSYSPGPGGGVTTTTGSAATAAGGEGKSLTEGAISRTGSGSGLGPVETATATLTSAGGVGEANPAGTGVSGSGTGTRGSGAGSWLAGGVVAVIMAALAGLLGGL